MRLPSPAAPRARRHGRSLAHVASLVALATAFVAACGGGGDQAAVKSGAGGAASTGTITGQGGATNTGTSTGTTTGQGGATTGTSTGVGGHGGVSTGTGGAGGVGGGQGGTTTGKGGAGGHGGQGGAGGQACGAGQTLCGGACVTTALDPDNCGGCGVVCPGAATCSAGKCLCPQGQLLCDDACVVLSNDAAHCGACDVACAPGQSCSGGNCVCPDGQSLCSGACVDTGADPKNCGACGALCGAKDVCSSGKCAVVCDPGLTACAGACVDLGADPKHCGACGTTCSGAQNASPACAGGQCAIACQPGFLDCDLAPANGCEVNGQADPKACGACGKACPAAPNAAPSCALGACTFACDAGFADCDKLPDDGCEAPLAADPLNCGVCGVVCPPAPHAVGACAAGVCGFACVGGFADCDGDPANGCEVDLASDPLHCASCGKACLVLPNAASTCTGGACGFSCQAGWLDCNLQGNDGCEVSSQDDAANCGACGAACKLANATATCSSGACEVQSCQQGFTDCDKAPGDGCEVATSSDPTSCGGCGYACEAAGVQTKKCTSGLCAPACAPGKGDCNGPAPGNVDDGCEATLATDPNNCGACGVVCAPGQKCCGGGCQQTSNCALTVAGVTPPAGWRNGGDFLTITGTGFGPGVKVLIDDGVAPAYAPNATTLYVQTPPHPDGVVDVKISMGVDTVVLKNGFSYKALGVSAPWQMKPMAKVRGEIPGVTVMKNGKVLVIGGTTTPDNPSLSLNTAEIYDRATDTVVPAGNAMSTVRWRNSGVTLLDGRVLVVGGCSGCAAGNSQSADLYDPATNLFSPAAPTNVARNNTHPVLLPDGRVFVASDATSVEIYDPVKNTWKLIAHAQAHTFGFAVRLRDGRVMLGGGDGGVKVVELFDWTTDTFTPTGSLNTGRSMLSAHTLPDGRVIVIGGANVSAGAVNAPQATMETWSPATGTWTFFPVNLKTPRCWHASALIRDGSILVMGGYPTTGSCTPTAAVEQVDPVKGTISPFASLGHANTEWAAVTMLDGSVLAVGGGACGQSSALPDLDFLPGSL